MRLLLDQGFARSAGPLLQQLGFEAIHVGDIGMAAATDRAILEEAVQREAVVVMFDADFISQLIPLLAVHRLDELVDRVALAALRVDAHDDNAPGTIAAKQVLMMATALFRLRLRGSARILPNARSLDRDARARGVGAARTGPTESAKKAASAPTTIVSTGSGGLT